MAQSVLVKVLVDHVHYCFENIDILFEAFRDEEFSKTVNGFPIWQQFYHLLNSIDRILTDPLDYAYPAFHQENLNNLEHPGFDPIAKKTLAAYFLDIKQAAEASLATLDEPLLARRSNHGSIRMTKLDHILAQLRHMTWHIGYLHSCAKVLHGATPEHILVRDKVFALPQ